MSLETKTKYTLPLPRAVGTHPRDFVLALLPVKIETKKNKNKHAHDESKTKTKQTKIN